MKSENRIKVEIWSDIMCPFCYIGKRHFEEALKTFGDKERVEVEWKSFQLDPDIPDPMERPVNVYQYLADRKGMSYEQSVQLHANVVRMAKAAGLDYNFDKAIVANSFSAHRLIQFAKEKGLGDKAEERLFGAYLTEGRNMGKAEELMKLGKDIGLSEPEVKEALTNSRYAEKVKAEVLEASELGVRGVPFFVLNRKYAVSGAQPVEAFLRALDRALDG